MSSSTSPNRKISPSDLHLVSWNLNGIRSATAKGLADFIDNEQPDILCFQECKADSEKVHAACELFPDYLAFHSVAEKSGYSGVSTLIRSNLAKDIVKARCLLSEESKSPSWFEREGRVLVMELKDVTLYNLYFPSGTSGEARQSLKYLFLAAMHKHWSSRIDGEQKPFVVCGDFNVCHQPTDIHHPEEAEKRGFSGYLPAERLWLDKYVSLGLIDTFRLIHGPNERQYTWWSYRANSRAKNLGWRIDYWFVSHSLEARVSGFQTHTEIKGSDHCPISVRLKPRECLHT